MREKEKFILVCPKCKSNHDCSNIFNKWRDEFMEKIDKLIKEMKG